jgi:hypothetical protein
MDRLKIPTFSTWFKESCQKLVSTFLSVGLTCTVVHLPRPVFVLKYIWSIKCADCDLVKKTPTTINYFQFFFLIILNGTQTTLFGKKTNLFTCCVIHKMFLFIFIDGKTSKRTYAFSCNRVQPPQNGKYRENLVIFHFNSNSNSK